MATEAQAYRIAAIAARVVADAIAAKDRPETAQDAMRAFAMMLERMAEVSEVDRSRPQ